MRTYRDITEAETDALKAFRKMHGRSWKWELHIQWMDKGCVTCVTQEQEDLLYCLRNSHGPTWLHRLRLPKE